MAGVSAAKADVEEHTVTSDGVKSTFAMYAINYGYSQSATLTKAEREDSASLTSYTVPLNGLLPYGSNTYLPYYTVRAVGTGVFKNMTSLQSVELSDGLRGIEEQAFYRCTGLRSVTWPSSLFTINSEAFYYCTNLRTLDLSGTQLSYIDARAFKGCLFLSRVSLPSSLLSIGTSAFSGCDHFYSLTLPSQLYHIGDSAFWQCSGLNSVKAEMQNPPQINSTTFYGINAGCTLTIPFGTKQAYAAKGWTDEVFRRGVVENDTLTIMQNGYRLTLVNKSYSGYELYLTEVNEYSNSEATLSIPDSVTVGTTKYPIGGIKANAGQGLTRLESLVLSPTLNKIYDGAFKQCTNLQRVTVSGLGVPCIYGTAFQGCSASIAAYVPYAEESEVESNGWTTTLFPGGVTRETIFTASSTEGAEVTYKVTGLNPNTVQVGTGDAVAVALTTTGSVTLPQTVTYEAGGERCTYSVTSVAEGAFEGITGITSVSLPKTLTSLGLRAFSGCSSLADVYSAIETPFDIDATVFENIDASAKLYVPQGTESLYRAKWWYGYFGGGMVNGETFVENGMTFLKLSATTVSIGDGTGPAISTSTSGALDIPATVEHDGVTYTVTALSVWAFGGCTNLTSVTVPEGIDEIPNSAFSGCTALATLSLPSSLRTVGNYAFNGCSGIVTLELPEGLETIGDQSFRNCTGLTTLTLPSTLTTIERAFDYCSALQNVYSHILTPMSIGGFYYTGASETCVLTVPLGTRDAYLADDILGWSDGSNGQTKVFNSIVEDNMAVVKTQEGVPVRYCLNTTQHTAMVGQSQYTDLTDSDYLSIPSGTTGTVTIPSSIEYLGQTYTVSQVGYKSFYNVTGLTSVSLPNTITSVGGYAFSLCTNLTTAVVPKTGSYMFSGCTALADVTITDETSDISMAAFTNCTSLAHIDLPAQAKTIGTNAFCYCTALDSVVIPSTVTSIGMQAFTYCTSLKYIVLPASLTTLGNDVFYYANKIESMVAKNPVPVDLTAISRFTTAFSSKCVLTVPVDTRDAYLAAGWTEKTAEVTDGRFLRVEEETVEANHTFLRAGSEAEVVVQWTQNSVAHELNLSNGIPETAYLCSTGLENPYLYMLPSEGYEVRVLRNGVDVTDEWATDGEYDGASCVKLQLDEIASVDEQVTWVVSIVPTTSNGTPGDVNQDGEVTIADVPALVDELMWQGSGALSDVSLQFDVNVQPSDSYTPFDIAVPAQLSGAFHLSASQIASKLLTALAEPQAGEIELVTYEGSAVSTQNYNTNAYTDGEIGYWYASDGNPMNWGSACLAIYFYKPGGKFCLVQKPGENTSGDTVTIRQALIYKATDGNTYTATLQFNITFDSEAANTVTVR